MSHRPKRIGSTTKLRIGVIPFCRIVPSPTAGPPALLSDRSRSSRQKRWSGHASSSSPAGHWTYSRVIAGERIETSAKPRS